ncbi:Na+/H+-dicarboxylate symporter [Arcticibacter tournemirensis]|uniref:Dicarboxylate/amino acid:cation symporter n=1 Tax=Arcticibacter tournemirensis TaxID=699437 RepID=A0A4Q0M327_9SPHI|nr:dicarboxylate/amino acid:cation symporter [Arcticibacter tournemirensis]KAA8475190.1 dicarboxylate/amino acid:cation symporter [Arcticibacter tournemirensis]RXF67308.1 dicarboxylate/amino acid:cation symporter [Arcticibacter tournemirensis]TQM52419.1 Na+/H+-dicarboxylate symporter [Arcticibacter tournemirensis]
MNNWLRNYRGIIWLIGGIIAGSVAGVLFGKRVEVLKPVGDIFLNLLFTAVIPLVFFAIASAIAGLGSSGKLSRIMGIMSLVFLSTVLISAFLTIVAVWLFPIHEQLTPLRLTESLSEKPIGEQLTRLFTTGEFYELLSRQNMLAMIIFSVLVGFATRRAGEKHGVFRDFIHAGNEVFKNVFILIMKLAPIGLGAYFAYQVGVFGPQLFGAYARSLGLFYGYGLFYFVVIFSLYAFIAGGVKGVRRYWKNNIIPSATALGTCSSIATIPANLDAARRIGIPDIIANVTVPLGATLHKDGSSISSIIKMAVVFALFGKSFDSVDVILLALGMTVLVSIVEGGIPNGGYVGEMLFISAYGFPPEALPPAMVIGTLVDPLATLLNATGDTVAGMLVSRFSEGRNWLSKTDTVSGEPI